MATCIPNTKHSISDFILGNLVLPVMTDCHAHLNDPNLEGFLESFRNGANAQLRIFSNSTDIASSKKNLQLASVFPSVEAFVGIHPELFLHHPQMSKEKLDDMCSEIGLLADDSSGIGEIGLDPKYGNFDLQINAMERQLEIAESRRDLPISIHARVAISECFDALSSYNIRNRVLFHWFSGTESELRKAHLLGYFTSFGLPALFSKRVGSLIASSDSGLLLAETDAPVVFESISKRMPITPFAIASVIFQMSIIRGISFDEMREMNERNSDEYLKRKPH